jgi:hypothetical protein
MVSGRLISQRCAVNIVIFSIIVLGVLGILGNVYMQKQAELAAKIKRENAAKRRMLALPAPDTKGRKRKPQFGRR